MKLSARVKTHRIFTFLLLIYLATGIILAGRPVPGQAQVEPPQPSAIAEPESTAEPQLPAGWLAQVERDLARAEYQVTWQEQTYLADLPAAYQAPNRAHNLRLYFTPTSVIVIPRTWLEETPNPPWEVEIALQAWGRSGGLDAPPAAAPEASENTIAYPHGEALENYRNDENGLLQVFSLPASFYPGEGPLRIQLALSSAGSFSLDASGARLTFNDRAGQAAMQYTALSARDAAGLSLPVWMSLEGSRLSLLVDDAQAAYPLQISALLLSLPTVPDWSKTYITSGAMFGSSVATAGDVNEDGYSDVIIGMPNYDNGQTNEGMAIVYPGSASGLEGGSLWYKESNQIDARFGSSVATAGDVDGDGDAEIIVAATDWDDNFTDGGGVWVYYGSSSGPSSTSGEYYQGVLESAHLGASIAPVGDVNADGYGDIIIGSPRAHDSIGQDDEGFAQVYYGSSSGLADTTSWRAEGEQSGALLGYSVGTAGDVNGDGISDVIAGAPRYNDGETDEGKAFVWYGADGGMSVITGTPANAAWSAAIDQADAQFGSSVSTAGDVNGDGYADVIVGAPLYSNGQSSEGAARLYLGSDSGLNTAYDNHDEANLQDAQFGHSVSLAGDVNGDGYADVMVGAPYYSPTGHQDGKAFLWLGSAAGISSLRDWTVDGNSELSLLGMSVATAGDVNGDGYSDIIVGAPGEASYAGAAFAYYGGPESLEDTRGWSEYSAVAGANFGYSVGAAGDVNADGYGDVIIGAPSWDSGQNNEGAAWVYLGRDTGLNPASIWFKQSDQVDAHFGWSVGGAGDVNGDGYSDIIVGAPYYDFDELNEGMVWVYLGKASGVEDPPDWYKDSDQTQAQFGYAVGTAGDVNGDGFSDVLVGAPFWNNGETNEGGVWEYHGSPGGLHTAPDWYMQSNAIETEFGYSLGTAGDINCDGYSDVIIGAPNWDNGQQDEGGAWVFTGSSAGLSGISAWHQEGGQIEASYGRSVGTAGDVNGDGFADIIVGVPRWNGLLADEGAAYVYLSINGVLETTASWSKRSNLTNAEYGWSVGTAGDVNGDGYADILVGAHFWTSGQTEEGGAWVYHGSASGVHSAPDWYAQGGQSFAWFGGSVASAGDVNGDAYADVIVGAAQFNNTVDNEGAAFLYYGNGGKGMPLGLHQIKAGGVYIAQLGATTNEFFYIDLRHFNTFGRGEAKMETETKPLGAVFTGQGNYIHTTIWFNLPTGNWHYMDAYPWNAPLGTPYHWRTRVIYNPATTPFMPASRWLTIPWNGWNETKLRLFGNSVFLPFAPQE